MVKIKSIKNFVSMQLLLIVICTGLGIFQANAQTDKINTAYNSSESIYVFTENGLTDTHVKAIAEKKDPYNVYSLHYIYSNDSHFGNSFNFLKIFFTKQSGEAKFKLNVIYKDRYNDFIYFLDQFDLHAHEEILTVFRYHIGIFECQDILVIISTDGSDYFLTDIYAESCGNKSCGTYRLSSDSDFYFDFFKKVDSKAAFEKVFPKYLKTSDFKEHNTVIYDNL
jgi:hypothetical protein